MPSTQHKPMTWTTQMDGLLSPRLVQGIQGGLQPASVGSRERNLRIRRGQSFVRWFLVSIVPLANAILVSVPTDRCPFKQTNPERLP